MKRRLLSGLFLWLALLAAVARGDEAELRVMTYNLRFASEKPPNAWSQRRPVMRELISQQAPDVIGTQEGLYQQLQDLAADLPDYRWIGLGREGGSRGEFMAVFYRPARLAPLEYDHFWLSETPELIGSTTWGNSNRRMVTWVKFRDVRTDQEFYLWNTHFDHQVQPAREKSAALLLDRLNRLKTTLPVLLVGDFNVLPEVNKVYGLLVNEAAFVDTWTAAEKRSEFSGTFHAFLGPAKNQPRIDWILARGPVTALESEVVTFSKDGQFPSDHFPVVARLRLGMAEPQ